MTLPALTLRALLSLASPQVVTPAIAELSEAITAAAVEADGAPFTGEHRRELASLALVALSWHESRFRADVARCDVTGGAPQRGREAITAFQLEAPAGWGVYSRAALCSDGRLAARQALTVLGWARCRDTLGMMRAYARGSCSKPRAVRVVYVARAADSVAARAKGRDRDPGATRWRTWRRLAREAGLR